MAKATSPASIDAFAPAFSSLKDMAYQQAGAYINTVKMAHFAIENIANFPKEVTEEAKAELYDGYRSRYSQLNPAKKYAVISDHLILATPEHEKAKGIELVEIGVDYAYSFSSQEFGKLANSRPELHRIIKDIREKCSVFCSNRLGDLKRAATNILNEGKEKKRTANKDFAEFVDAWFTDVALTRLKGAKSRNDATADEAKFTKAKVAFMVEWNRI